MSSGAPPSQPPTGGAPPTINVPAPKPAASSPAASPAKPAAPAGAPTTPSKPTAAPASPKPAAASPKPATTTAAPAPASPKPPATAPKSPAAPTAPKSPNAPTEAPKAAAPAASPAKPATETSALAPASAPAPTPAAGEEGKKDGEGEKKKEVEGSVEVSKEGEKEKEKEPAAAEKPAEEKEKEKEGSPAGKQVRRPHEGDGGDEPATKRARADPAPASTHAASGQGDVLDHLRKKVMCADEAGSKGPHFLENPKKLPCSHLMCLACAEGHLKEGKMTCPTCGTVHDLSGGVTSLPIDVITIALLNDPTFMASLAPEPQFLVPDPPLSSRAGKNKICTLHPGSELEFLCEDCQVAVCSKCVAREHKQHEIAFGEEIDTLLEAVEKCKKAGEESALTASKQVEDMVQDMRKLLEDRRAQLLEQVAREKEDLLNNVHRIRDKLQDGSDDLGKLEISALKEARTFGTQQWAVKADFPSMPEMLHRIGSLGKVTNSRPKGLLLCGHENGLVTVWDATSGISRLQLQVRAQQANGAAAGENKPFGVESVCIVDSAKGIVACGSNDHAIRVWDVVNGKCLQTLHGHEAEVDSVTLVDAEQMLVASGSVDKTVRVWNLKTMKCVHVLKGHDDGIWDMCTLSESKKLVVSGSEDKTVRVWDAAKGRLRTTLRGHVAEITSVCVADASKMWLASASKDKTVRVWEAVPGRSVFVFAGHEDEVWAVTQVDPDRGIIASGSNDRTVRVWNVREGRLVCALLGHEHEVWAVIPVNPAQNLIASGSKDKTVRVWDYGKGLCTQVLRGHTDGIWTLSVVDEAKGIIASGSWDKTARLWNVHEGRCLHVLQTDSAVLSLAYMPLSQAPQKSAESGEEEKRDEPQTGAMDVDK